MSVRLLLDEHVEHELRHRLLDLGHDVEHVENVQPLGKSTSDEEIAAYSLETGAVVVTYDADFVLHLDETACAGVLYFPDESLATGTVAQIIDTILAHYPASELGGILYAGTEWL